MPEPGTFALPIMPVRPGFFQHLVWVELVHWRVAVVGGLRAVPLLRAPGHRADVAK